MQASNLQEVRFLVFFYFSDSYMRLKFRLKNTNFIPSNDFRSTIIQVMFSGFNSDTQVG